MRGPRTARSKGMPKKVWYLCSDSSLPSVARLSTLHSLCLPYPHSWLLLMAWPLAKGALCARLPVQPGAQENTPAISQSMGWLRPLSASGWFLASVCFLVSPASPGYFHGSVDLVSLGPRPTSQGVTFWLPCQIPTARGLRPRLCREESWDDTSTKPPEVILSWVMCTYPFLTLVCQLLFRLFYARLGWVSIG